MIRPSDAPAILASVPEEPPPTQWQLPSPDNPEAVGELVGVGADLEPGTLLAAYRQGLFPMPLPQEHRAAAVGLAPIGWWSPDPRGILPLENLQVSRSLRKSLRSFEIRIDTAFDAVISACADPSREHGWIDAEIVAAYTTLHRLGWAHSVEAWSVEDGELVGGLYGVSTGAFFAGESMFHRRTDASKAALVGLVTLLNRNEYQLLDVQWCTEHLASLGAVEVSRDCYLQLLAQAVGVPAVQLGPLAEPLRF